jgi:ATP/maltotriose-dependent transcriptional regulator MalT
VLQYTTSGEEIAALHREAITWFAANGLIEEALHHALGAGDSSSAVDLVVRHRHEPRIKSEASALNGG